MGIKLPFSIGAIISFLIFSIAILPVMNVFISYPLAKAFLTYGTRRQFIEEVRFYDYPIIAIVSLLVIIIGGMFVVDGLLATNILLILLAGIIVDAILWITNPLFILLQKVRAETVLAIVRFVAGATIFFSTMFIVGGFGGVVLGFLGSLLVFSPFKFFPIPVALIFFIVVKFLIEVIF